MVYERALPQSASAFEIARCLATRSAPLLCSVDQGRKVFIACDPLAVSHELDPEPNLGLRATASTRVPRWFGLVPYEARRELERNGAADERAPALISRPLWRRYAAWVEVTARGSRVVGDDEAEVSELARDLERQARQGYPARGLASLTPTSEEVGELHIARIRRALEEIKKGEIYEVNLARRLDFRRAGHPFDLLERLAAPVLWPYSLALAWPELEVVASSPELALGSEASGRAWTSPIKGTRPRDRDPGRDVELARELDQDPKEIAELTMVLDVERNDLGRVSEPGSVRVSPGPHIVSHPTVHHRQASVEGSLRPDVDRRRLLEAMLPSGSVTGAPKIRAMELIAELEAERRGLYTGAFGVIFQDGSVELGMAIRTLVLSGDRAEYFAGGGIVADSIPERELEETRWKAAHLLAALGDEG